MEDLKQFPNGFSSWQETHFEVVAHIVATTDLEGSRANEAQTSKGTGGLYELAEDLTDQFETLNKDRAWDGEFFDEIHDFLEKEA